MTHQSAPYGTWPSPISAELLVVDAVDLCTPWADGGATYWVEGRPSEGGREVLVRRSPAGIVEEVLPEAYSVRTLVHEYGGRCVVTHEGVAYFSNFADQRLYRRSRVASPFDHPGTAERAGMAIRRSRRDPGWRSPLLRP